MDTSNKFEAVKYTTSDGEVKIYRYQEHVVPHQIVPKVKVFGEDIDGGKLFCTPGFGNIEPVKTDESTITGIKLSKPEDMAVVQQRYRIPNVPVSIRCQNCKITFRTKHQYCRHQCEFNEENVVLKPDATIEDTSKKYICETCNKQFVRMNNLERHQLSHDSTQVNVCEHCKKPFLTENGLMFHKENHCKKSGKVSNKKRSDANEKAPDGLKFQCDRCLLTFDSIIDLDDHREKGHACTFSGQQCDQVASSANALEVHTRTNHRLKLYLCEKCGRTYPGSFRFLQHFRSHQGIKPYVCPHANCDARYTILSTLKDHIRKVHTRQRPYKCLVCSMCFLTGSAYYQHRLTHSDERRHGCNVCGKRFHRADNLKCHRRIHTNETPYSCEICGSKFKQKSVKNRHMRTHN